jgi:hypothetical protein
MLDFHLKPFGNTGALCGDCSVALQALLFSEASLVAWPEAPPRECSEPGEALLTSSLATSSSWRLSGALPGHCGDGTMWRTAGYDDHSGAEGERQ